MTTVTCVTIGPVSAPVLVPPLTRALERRRPVRAGLGSPAAAAVIPLTVSPPVARRRGHRVGRLAAAAVAALAWVPALVRGRAAAPAASDPLVTVVSWAEAGAIPEGADLYRVLGVNDER